MPAMSPTIFFFTELLGIFVRLCCQGDMILCIRQNHPYHSIYVLNIFYDYVPDFHISATPLTVDTITGIPADIASKRSYRILNSIPNVSISSLVSEKFRTNVASYKPRHFFLLGEYDLRLLFITFC